MRSRVLLWSVVSALAGFLFGFDTVVISGAEMTIQALWRLSPERHGLATGAALWGTLAGSLLRGWPADRFGRKRTLLWVGVLFLVGSIWSALAAAVWSFIAARFLGRVGIGVSTVAAPLHLGDRAPRVAGPADGTVSVHNRVRHPRRLPVELRAVEARFKAIEVLRRQPEGTWKLIVGGPNDRG